MRKNLKKIAIIGLALFLIALAVYFFFIRFNFHTVIAGQVYRCAQPSAQQLAQIKTKYGIRSVLNLRSIHSSRPIYQTELRVCRSLRIKLFHFRMSPKKFPGIKQLKQLVNLLQKAPKPMLIHCKAGADRTGLASAIMLILHDYPIFAIKHQYSFHYLVVSPNSVGKLVIPYYLCWLRDHKLQNSRKNFLLWMHQLRPGINFPLPSDNPTAHRISIDVPMLPGDKAL